MKINQYKEWKLDADQETFDVYKDLKVCDTFDKNGTERVSDARSLNINEIRQIEGWINCQIEDYQLPEDWSGRNMIERLAYIIAAGYFQTECKVGSDQDGYWHEIGDHLPMYELIKEIDDFSLRSLNCAFQFAKNKEIPYASYKSVLFPLIVESIFSDFQSDKKYKSIRYRAWYDQVVGKFIDRKTPVESDTSYKGIELRSPGHLKICRRLEDDGVMFFFEAPAFIFGDEKKYRRIDLVVIKNNRAVIVEIDGASHRSIAQQEDDNERDRLIRKNWTNTLRISHDEATNRTPDAIQKIYDELDPKRGSIS